MNTATICILVAIVLYLLMMVTVGLVQSRKTKNTSDFYLGGRKLGPFVTAMSAEASDMSGWLLMGLPAVALMGGLPEAAWTAIGLAVGTYINWLIVSKRLRIYSEKLGAVTIPEYFSKRFGDKKNILTCIAAVVIVIFFVPYTASGFSACGKLFASLFGVDYHFAMIASAAIITLYCTLGGFLAASTTDFVQSIVMTIALFVVIGFGEGITGGFGTVFANAGSMNGYLDLFKGFDVGKGVTTSYGALPVFSTLAWGLGYFGMPHILLRFMAIESPSKLKTSRRVASIWVVISMAVAVLIGIVGFSLMKNGVVGPYADASAAETIIVDIARALSKYGIIPAVTAGIILSGILASTMSTADSQLLAAASSITQDLTQHTFKVKLSEKFSMWFARIAVIVIAIIAVFIAWDSTSSVFRIVSFAWAGFGAAFGPVMLCSLFWKRSNKWGALAGMIAGGITVFVWKFVVREVFSGTILDIYELLPAFIVALVAIVVVSLLTKAPEKEVTDVYEEARKAM